MNKKIAVLGAGSWGTALAILAARNGCRTLLWGHNPEHMAALAQDRENKRYLPGLLSLKTSLLRPTWPRSPTSVA